MKAIVELIRPFAVLIQNLAPAGSTAVNQAVQNAVTIPQAQIDALCRGMSADDTIEARRLARVASDAVADLIVHVGSRGLVDAD
jgi:hypothetical protein